MTSRRQDNAEHSISQHRAASEVAIRKHCHVCISESIDAKTARLDGKRRDTKTRLARDLLELKTSRRQDFQTPRDHDACVFNAGKADLAHRSVAVALLSGSASGAARAKASSVCKLSSNEQE